MSAIKDYYHGYFVEIQQKQLRMKRNFILIIIVLASQLLSVGYMLKKERDRNELLSTTIESFKEGNKYNSDSTIIESIVKRLDISDIKKFFPELRTELKEHGIKINALQQYQNTQLEMNAEISASVKRIVAGNDTTIISRYTDKWIKFLNQYKVGDTTSKATISMPVDIKQAIYQYRKPWILWRFKPVKLKQKMWTDNPYAKLNYNDVLQVTK